MPLSPPWNWIMHNEPADTDEVWIIRIGNPEKPFRATYQQASQTFETMDLPTTLYVPSLLVSKWRPL